jgi:hypothetical protein
VYYDGAYKYPVPKEGLLTSLRDDLAPAEALGVRMWTATKEGSLRKKTIQEIMDEYGTVSRKISGSLVLDRSLYVAPEETYWEAFCPPREIQPIYHAQIDQWLRLLGGTQADKLLDWIATINRFDIQTSALYLSGKASAGKSMLAHGLARLWTDGGPVDLSDVVGSAFNDGVVKCPLIFGDEAVSCSTTDLRHLVGSSSYTLRRKFLPTVSTQGALRVILADNGGRMLIKDEDLNGEDLGALALKFLHIHVGQAPVDFLASIGGRIGTNAWVIGDMIAQHAVWLRGNRNVVPGNRFLVEGHITSMTRNLAVQGKVPSLVCEWIAGYLDRPASIMDKLVVVGAGKILINVDALSIHWNNYVHSEHKAPSKTRIGKALGNISDSVKRVGTRRYHSVKPDLIYEWVENNLVGDIDAIKRRVDAVLDVSIQIDDG